MIFDLGLPIKEKKLKLSFMNWNEFKWIKEKKLKWTLSKHDQTWPKLHDSNLSWC